MRHKIKIKFNKLKFKVLSFKVFCFALTKKVLFTQPAFTSSKSTTKIQCVKSHVVLVSLLSTMNNFTHCFTHLFVCFCFLADIVLFFEFVGNKANVGVSGGKKCSFLKKFGVLCFFETPVLRFALLPYYRRIIWRNFNISLYCIIAAILYLSEVTKGAQISTSERLNFINLLLVLQEDNIKLEIGFAK